LAVIKSHTQKQLLGSTNLKAGHPCFQLFLCHKITHLPPITHILIHFFLFFPFASRLAHLGRRLAVSSPPEHSARPHQRVGEDRHDLTDGRTSPSPWPR
jgi:hypothetical protein